MHAMHRVFLSLVPLLLAAKLCSGHACDDPWRPDPSNAGNPGSSPSAPIIPAPPPPPPAPGENPSPSGPGANSNGPAALANQVAPGGADDISPDNIVLIPESSPKIIGDKGEFRMYVVNRSPRDLFAVKLEAVSSVFETKVEPESIKRLVSGEKELFSIKLKAKEKLKSGKFPMDFKVSSRGNLIYEGSLNKQEKQAEENLCIRIGAEPIEISQTGSFQVFVKNNIYNEVNNVKVNANSGYFEIQSDPASVAKLSPGSEAKFTITLKAKNVLKAGSYDIRLHAITNSRNVFTSRILAVKVTDKKAGKSKK